eukprot:TRINITY_DN36488_c0_g1_i1.p1 TRINITY_DN36488_c0_g1~~TRINITY_DN36488_c0_g1_i1.p1  ORF type:complete len:454 (-),score=57.01 TRINITY_DN36488_c0_g1_i1:64-1401(-)
MPDDVLPLYVHGQIVVAESEQYGGWWKARIVDRSLDLQDGSSGVCVEWLKWRGWETVALHKIRQLPYYRHGDQVLAFTQSGNWQPATVQEHDIARRLVCVAWRGDNGESKEEVLDSFVCRPSCFVEEADRRRDRRRRGKARRPGALTESVLSRLTCTTLSPPDLDRYTVQADQDGWMRLALRLFRRNGFVVVRMLVPEDTCRRLRVACESAEREIRDVDPEGNRGSNRWSFAVASLTGSTVHEAGWSDLLRCKPLMTFMHYLMPSGGTCVLAGGDFVTGGEQRVQRIHSDLPDSRPLATFPAPYIAANVAVHDVTADNGPMRMIPGTQAVGQMAVRRGLSLPGIWEEPTSWYESRLHDLGVGDVIFRDVRTLHGGTENNCTSTRFLPSLEFALDEYLDSSPGWTVSAAMPDDVYETLPVWAQKWCRRTVLPRQDFFAGWRCRERW